MIRYSRQQAKLLGLPTCYGSLCKKHPELDGLRRVSGSCVECAKESVRERRKVNPEKTKAQALEYRKKSLFNLEAVARKRTQDAEYRRKNKEKIRASILEWNRKNPEKVKIYAQRVKQNNKGKVNFHTAKRRYLKMQRTPHWLTEDDRWMIQEAYDLAALRTKLFGFSWHVDHILPLQGKTVSGLHVPLNLQVIPGKENLTKHNKHEVQF
jgi:hypothetical protein